MKRAKTTTIEQALRILSQRFDLQDEHGVAGGACIEAAERLQEMRGLFVEAEKRAIGSWPTSLRAAIKRAIT